MSEKIFETVATCFEKTIHGMESAPGGTAASGTKAGKLFQTATESKDPTDYAAYYVALLYDMLGKALARHEVPTGIQGRTKRDFVLALLGGLCDGAPADIRLAAEKMIREQYPDRATLAIGISEEDPTV